MTEDQDASHTTYLAPSTSSPLLGERELLTWKRREKEDAQRASKMYSKRNRSTKELEWFQLEQTFKDHPVPPTPPPWADTPFTCCSKPHPTLTLNTSRDNSLCSPRTGEVSTAST